MYEKVCLDKLSNYHLTTNLFSHITYNKVYKYIKFTDMIKLINLIVKILATIIVFFPIAGLLTILSIIFWDTKYTQVADDILEKMIWERR